MNHISSALDRNSGDIDLLLALSNPWMRQEEAEEVRSELVGKTGEADWSWILDQGARHRVLPLIGHNIKRFRLYQSTDGDTALIPRHWVYTTVFEGNRARNRVLFDEFARILSAVAGAGVAHAVRKGPLLCERFFPDPGMRRTNDLDVLVSDSGARTVAGVLADLGYQQGRLSADGRTRPYQRSTEAFWRLHVNNALPFVKPTDAPGVDCFVVDLCLSVLPGRERRATGSADFLERAVETVACGVPTRSLCPADELLDICVHLHKEADIGYYIANGNDIALSKFIDVANAIKNTDDEVLREFTERARHYRVQESAYFSVKYTAVFYPDLVPEWLLEELRPAGDLSYLDEYGHLEGSVRSWQHGFLARAFDTRRSELMEGRSSVPLS